MIKLDDNRIISLYNDNHSALSISKMMGVDSGTIRNRLNKNGITCKKHRKYLINKEYFKIINNESAYWLGFIMADGYNSGVFIRVDIQDEYHLEKLRDDIYPNRDMPVRKRLSPTSAYVYYLTMQDIDLVNDCYKLGIVERKSHITKYPDISEEFDKDFIRGLFDGDGSLSTSMSGKYIKYTFSIVGSFDLMKSVQSKICVLGINAKFHKCKSIYRIIVSGNQQILKLLNWIYKDSNVYLDRKYFKYLDLLQYCKTRRKLV